MKSPFGEIFLFLTDLAWKNRVTIPALVTTVFLIMDIRLQIEINIQTGQLATADANDFSDDDDDDEDDDDDDDDELDGIDDYSIIFTDGSDEEEENENIYIHRDSGSDSSQQTSANTVGRPLVLS